MLAEIQVRNFALISELQLKFSNGLNILTGETGAGKSIIIDALGLALGERFSPEMMRSGEGELFVEAVFTMPLPGIAYDFLQKQGIGVKEGEEIILVREANANGRNRCRINGHTVTVGTLAELSRHLVDIHGQHEHQSLLQTDKHLDLLDRFGGEELLRLKRETAEIYKEREKYRRLLSETIMNEQEKARRIELYNFQIREIETVNPRPGEEEQLESEAHKLSSTEKLSQLSQSIYFVLNEEGDGGSVARIGQAVREMEEIARIDPETTEWLQTLRGLKSQAEEAARFIRTYQEKINFDPEALALCQQRLNDIQTLKRKYGPNIEDVLNYKEKITRELGEIERMESDREEHRLKLSQVEELLAKKAGELSEKRKETGQILAQKIEEQLNELNMKNTKFVIRIDQKDDPEGLPWQGRKVAVSEHGIDTVEFLVAPNLGEEPRPLQKIASGGELSRLMLGIKTILAEIDDLPTMIFDEIDAGIGGRTAQVVAEKLILIGQQRQVLCITHLPQIASMGHAHFYLEKIAKEGRTFVTVKLLNMAERVHELARMLGGAAVTGTTLEHAQEMLGLAEQVKLKKVGLHS